MDPVVFRPMLGDASPHVTLHYGYSCLQTLKEMSTQSVHCIVTGPPYWKLRNYGDRVCQIGQEDCVEDYITRLVEVFDEARRVLRDDGTLWVNLADTRAHKSLQGVPYRFPLAMQEAGWNLRQDIIWAKSVSLQHRQGSCRAEGVRDRPTDSHEHLFFFSKSRRYYYDQECMKEEAVSLDPNSPSYRPNSRAIAEGTKDGLYTNKYESRRAYGEMRNLRSVWLVQTKPYKGAHPAAAPPELYERCVVGGCPPGGTVLDPFSGSATVGRVAVVNGRNYVGLDLNTDYLEGAILRIRGEAPLVEERGDEEEGASVLSLFR